MVQRVEEFGAGFKSRPLRKAEAADQCQVHSLHTGTIDRVAADITKSVSGCACNWIAVKLTAVVPRTGVGKFSVLMLLM